MRCAILKKRLFRKSYIRRPSQISGIARLPQQTIRNSLKSPWCAVALFQKVLANHWYPVPMAFSRHPHPHLPHKLIYACPEENPTIKFFQNFEFWFLFVYGVIFPLYIFYRKTFSESHYIYRHLTWITISLSLVLFVAALAMSTVAWFLKCQGSCLGSWFNALLLFKRRLQLSHQINYKSHNWIPYKKRRLTYSIYANTIVQGFIIVIPPMTFCLNLFGCDPAYFLFNEILFCWLTRDNFPPWLVITCHIVIFMFRWLVNIFCGLLAGGRFLSFVLLIDCCRIWIYDYLLTAMSTINCPFTLYKVYTQLRICHTVIGGFYSNFYSVFMAFCQVIIVVEWWIGFVTIGRIPFIVWLMFPLMAAECAVGAFLYLRMVHKVHSMSKDLVQSRPLQLQLKRKGNSLLRLKWRGVRGLDIRCGLLFEIKSQTLLTSLHLVMNNLGTFIIINDFRKILKVW